MKISMLNIGSDNWASSFCQLDTQGMLNFVFSAKFK